MWLLAYSKNINIRQLTFRLGKRSKLKDLAEGWILYQQKFDTVAMAALLRRIRAAQLHDPDFQPSEAQRMIDDLEPRLRKISLVFGRLRDITAYLHALAKLHSPPPSAFTRSTTTTAIAATTTPNTSGSSFPGAGPDAKQRAPPSFSHDSELLLDLALVATRNRSEMLQASPQQLATLLWALHRLLPESAYGSEKLQVVLDRVALCSIARLQNFTPPDMRIYSLAYATFGPRGGAATQPPKPTPQPPLPPAAAAAAARGKTAAPSVPAASGAEEFTGVGRPSAWPAAAKSVRASPAGSEAEDPAGPGEAPKVDPVARRRSRNVKVLQALADELAARFGNLALPQPEPRDLAVAAHALALQGGLPPHLPLLAKAATAAAGSLHRLQPGEVVALVEALAAQGVRQQPLLDAVRRQAAGWGGAGEEGEAGRLQARLAAAYESLGASL